MNRSRLPVFFALFFFLLQSAFAGVNEAKQLLAEGNYSQGKSALIQACSAIDPEQKAEAYAELARFYRDLAGDSDLARVPWIQIKKLPLPANHPLVQQAKEELAALRLEDQTFAEQNKILAAASRISNDNAWMEQQINQLEELLQAHPDFPGAGKAYLWRGVHLQALGLHQKAWRSLNQAEKNNPALGLSLPLDSTRIQARTEFLIKATSQGSLSAMGFIFIVAIVLAWRARRAGSWKGLPTKGMIPMVAGLCAIFLLTTAVLFFMDFTQADLPFVRPVILKKLWFQEGGFRLLAVFIYSLVVMAGTFVMALGTAGWRSRPMRLCTLLLTSLLLSAFCVAEHYAVFLSRNTTYAPAHGGVFYTLLELNKNELPGSRQEILDLLSNANPEELTKMLEYHLPEMPQEAYFTTSAEELADLLMQKEEAE
jgi:tetratricopeptide (TPR) repeat protein